MGPSEKRVDGQHDSSWWPRYTSMKSLRFALYLLCEYYLLIFTNLLTSIHNFSAVAVPPRSVCWTSELTGCAWGCELSFPKMALSGTNRAGRNGTNCRFAKSAGAV